MALEHKFQLSLDEQRCVCIVDFEKAFDKIKHDVTFY